MPRLLRRDAGAEVERLYRKYSAEVQRYALLVLRSRTDAEDITQAVFMRALGAIERGEKVRTPRNWLIKIAHNECRRLLSTRRIHAELPEQLVAEPQEPGRAEELTRALSALPEAQRQALVQRELEGRTYAEIAATLSLSVSAVETLIFRARRTLREQLEDGMSCDEFAQRLDDPAARSRVRAHARVCADCATLERQARGRKSALKRIASSLGLPWWGAKVAAVALTTATVAAVAVASPPHHPHSKPVGPAPAHSTLIPLLGTRVTRPTAAPAAATRHTARPVVARTKVSGTALVSGTSPAAAPSPAFAPAPTAVLPGPEPPAKPEPEAPQPAPVPPPTKSVPSPAPVALPNLPLTAPPVAVPAIPPAPPLPIVPAATLPTVSVPVPPTPPVPPLPVAPGGQIVSGP